MALHGPLLFVLSHYTEEVVEDLEKHKRDALEQTLYVALRPTLEQVTPLEVFTRITETLLRYLEHDRPMVRQRMLEMIQRIIALRPRHVTPSNVKEKGTPQ
jgi:hypothetical protein